MCFDCYSLTCPYAQLSITVRSLSQKEPKIHINDMIYGRFAYPFCFRIRQVNCNRFLNFMVCKT